MDFSALADLLFPGVFGTPDELEARFPPRSLPEGARVTRMAPSPTGFMHLGNRYGAIADERLAHPSGGVFYLRIEDTDQKREVAGGVETILHVFREYGLPFDEGVAENGERFDCPVPLFVLEAETPHGGSASMGGPPSGRVLH